MYRFWNISPQRWWGGTTPQIRQRSASGQGPKMTGFLKFWWHIFAPNSRQSAGIALKTSPIESSQFSISKLCPNFFFNSDKKYFSSWSKMLFEKKSVKIVDHEEKYLLSELKKKLGHSFDVENWELSISEVFRVIPALCRAIDANMCYQR